VKIFCKWSHRSAVVLLLTLTAITPRLWGQGRGTISGNVSDPTGAVISAIVVTATQSGTGAATNVQANESGHYVFPFLPPASYSISIAAPGFRNFVERGVILQADRTEIVNVVLALGEASQTVSVAANAVQVDATTGTLSQVIDQGRGDDLPLNGRNAAQLVTLVAGVVLAPVNNSDQRPSRPQLPPLSMDPVQPIRLTCSMVATISTSIRT
jgi:hypothetical protein